jgi:hypothetical protein
LESIASSSNCWILDSSNIAGVSAVGSCRRPQSPAAAFLRGHGRRFAQNDRIRPLI